MTAAGLERVLVAQYGPDFRDKTIVGPLGSFKLSSAFEECGLQDPRVPSPSSIPYGLYQF